MSWTALLGLVWLAFAAAYVLGPANRFALLPSFLE